MNSERHRGDTRTIQDNNVYYDASYSVHLAAHGRVEKEQGSVCMANQSTLMNGRADKPD